MSVDVLDIERGQLFAPERRPSRYGRGCEGGGLAETPRSHSKGRNNCQRWRRSEARRRGGAHKLIVGERLKKTRFFPESAFRFRLRCPGETRLPLQQITRAPQRRSSVISSIT